MSTDGTLFPYSSPEPLDPVFTSEDPVEGGHNVNKRTDLLRRLNAKLASTQNLPPEILSLIFQFACPTLSLSDIVKRYDSGNKRSPGTCHHLVYAAVSSLWRHVVWSTPQLWTLLFLFMDETNGNEETQFLDLYLQNSGDLHLSLKVGSSNWGCPPDDLLKDIIHKTASRLKSLILVNFTNNSLTPLSTLAFPRLQEFGIINDCGTKLSQLVINEAPSLERFALRVFEYWFESSEPIRIPLSSITWVNVGFIPSRLAVQFLQKCPDLADFAYIGGEGADDDDDDGDDFELEEPLILPQLQSFAWTDYDNLPLYDLIEGLHVPNLRTLSVDFFAPSDVRVWTDFFKRLPKSLRNLHLHEFPSSWHNTDLFHPLHFLVDHGIQELALRRCHREFVEGILETLAIYDEENKTPGFLPSLRTLLVKDCGDMVEEMRGNISSMVEKRYGNPSDLPPLKLSLTWGRNICEELVPQGILLELLD